jgi:nicotinate phosphoribosyltransferase
MAESLFPEAEHLGLLTDLYQLTMAAGYFVHGLAGRRATFELWVRRLPEQRNFLVAAGLEQAVHYLTHLHFGQAEIEYLRQHPSFGGIPAEWFEHLAQLRFRGDVWAVPEGTVVFPGEPLLRVTADLDVAQIIETYLITCLSIQTMVASKAARCVLAAGGRKLIDFGTRRAHGPQAGMLAARAAFLAGFHGTSNTEAGRRLGIPTLGTQAHAWIMAHEEERAAFSNFGRLFTRTSTLLIDTYDTLQGARNVLASGAPVQAVRLDSGDLAGLSRGVRQIFDEAGRNDVQIVASGDLNEFKIRQLLAGNAPVDVFGVGTELVTSRDEPTLSTVYKLVEQETDAGPRGRFKLAEGKKSYPFAKQVWRQPDERGSWQGDVVGRAVEELPGQALLVPVLRQGELTAPLPSLAASREHCLRQLAEMPAELRSLDPVPAYPVRISERLEADTARLVASAGH